MVNNSVTVVQTLQLALLKSLNAVTVAYLEAEPTEASELLSAKVLTELLAQGYYVMTKEEILNLIQESIKEGFFALGKGK